MQRTFSLMNDPFLHNHEIRYNAEVRCTAPKAWDRKPCRQRHTQRINDVDMRASDPRGGDPRIVDRQTMDARNAMDARTRDEERRRRDAGTINNLQQQIDELRGLMREYVARSGRSDEIVKSVEAMAGDVRADLEDHRRATMQHAQARQLDENRMRQNLAQLHGGITEAHAEVRTLQAQVTELIEQSRARRDTTDLTNRRFDELQAQITRAFAQQERFVEVVKAVRESVEEVRVGIAQFPRDIQRVDDAIHIVDSEAKRRVVEIEQRIEVLPPRIEEVAKRVITIENGLKGLGDEFARIHHALQALAATDVRVEEEYNMHNEQSLERHDLVLERIEEVRQQGDAVARDLRHAAEERDVFLANRQDAFDEGVRDIAHRISLVNTRVDEVGQRIAEVRKELARAAEVQVRSRYRQAQEELEEVIELNRRVAMSDGPPDEKAPRPLRFGERGYASGGER